MIVIIVIVWWMVYRRPTLLLAVVAVIEFDGAGLFGATVDTLFQGIKC